MNNSALVGQCPQRQASGPTGASGFDSFGLSELTAMQSTEFWPIKKQSDLLLFLGDDRCPLAYGPVKVCVFVHILPLLYSNLGVLSSTLSCCYRPSLDTV